MIGESGEIVCGQSRRLNLNFFFFLEGVFVLWCIIMGLIKILFGCNIRIDRIL